MIRSIVFIFPKSTTRRQAVQKPTTWVSNRCLEITCSKLIWSSLSNLFFPQPFPLQQMTMVFLPFLQVSLGATLDSFLFLLQLVSASPAGSAFKIQPGSHHLSPTHCHHHDPSHHARFLVTALASKLSPSFHPCPSIVNFQYGKQSNPLYFNIRQVTSVAYLLKIFHWLLISFKMKAKGIQVVSRTMHPLAPTSFPIKSTYCTTHHSASSHSAPTGVFLKHHHVPPPDLSSGCSLCLEYSSLG